MACPPWLKDPLDQKDVTTNNLESNALEFMQTCDLNIVCGMIPTRTAVKSGVPYIIYPHGGDIRTAAGFHGPKTLNILEKYGYYKNVVTPLREAYTHALFVGSH